MCLESVQPPLDLTGLVRVGQPADYAAAPQVTLAQMPAIVAARAAAQAAAAQAAKAKAEALAEAAAAAAAAAAAEGVSVASALDVSMDADLEETYSRLAAGGADEDMDEEPVVNNAAAAAAAAPAQPLPQLTGGSLSSAAVKSAAAAAEHVKALVAAEFEAIEEIENDETLNLTQKLGALEQYAKAKTEEERYKDMVEVAATGATGDVPVALTAAQSLRQQSAPIVYSLLTRLQGSDGRFRGTCRYAYETDPPAVTCHATATIASLDARAAQKDVKRLTKMLLATREHQGIAADAAAALQQAQAAAAESTVVSSSIGISKKDAKLVACCNLLPQLLPYCPGHAAMEVAVRLAQAIKAAQVAVRDEVRALYFFSFTSAQ
jgi:hypothetical protein